ncbi:MAG: hypothetical protein ABEJ72_08355 [Candidatus Aenigmatarchaeota archaeon]
MKSVFHFKSEDKSEVEEILEEDPVSRLSITQRDCESLEFDMNGFFVLLDGDDEKVKRAKERLEDMSETLEEEVKEEVIEKIEKAEQESMESFGSIFG